MTLYSSSCLSETDIMACGACRIMKKGCNADCPFAHFFGPQDTERFRTIKRLYSVQAIRNLLRDPNTTREDKEHRLQEWYEEAVALEVAQILQEWYEEAVALEVAQILVDLKNG